MLLMTAAMIVGTLLSVLVVLDALRPKQTKHVFAAPRRRQAARVADTMTLEPKTLDSLTCKI